MQYIKISVLEGEDHATAKEWYSTTAPAYTASREAAQTVVSVLNRAMSGLQELTKQWRFYGVELRK